MRLLRKYSIIILESSAVVIGNTRGETREAKHEYYNEVLLPLVLSDIGYPSFLAEAPYTVLQVHFSN